MTATQRTRGPLRGACTVAAAVAVGARIVRRRHDNPLDNPPTVSNPTAHRQTSSCPSPTSRSCINPIFLAQLPIHSATARLDQHLRRRRVATTTPTAPAARFVSCPTRSRSTSPNPANTPDVIRASDMYKNFYSAQGDGGDRLADAEPRCSPSRWCNGVLHGGGLVFETAQRSRTRKLIAVLDQPPGARRAGRVQHREQLCSRRRIRTPARATRQ